MRLSCAPVALIHCPHHWLLFSIFRAIKNEQRITKTDTKPRVGYPNLTTAWPRLIQCWADGWWNSAAVMKMVLLLSYLRLNIITHSQQDGVTAVRFHDQNSQEVLQKQGTCMARLERQADTLFMLIPNARKQYTKNSWTEWVICT
jgi:hypothetical protein